MAGCVARPPVPRLFDAIARFFTDRVFGEQRRAILAADPAGADDTAHREREAKRARLERAVAEVDRQQQSLLGQARQGDPADPFTQALRGSYNDLEKDRRPHWPTWPRSTRMPTTEPLRRGRMSKPCSTPCPT
ncbi:hypothetical protein [Amycolatopsis sp. YIM 10]|uniref:hypothetical protein n=1 Tax=Amycolatopsis sp. YIM 10 TaxID=2653857 RepID=UPI00129028D6|nr:hypothetical protein [Amycolatopsis sp. YIM 10]QFU91641.1 hypothetical protein YIM_32400 [Amycolatopsis sp. YIM 10]